MALSGWTKSCSISIAANKLPYTHANQVVTLYTSHFPTGMVTSGGADACKSDGGDIRFSSDAAGNVLLPFDIEVCSLNATPANSVLIVHFKTSVTANAAFTVYCWWGNPQASAPAKDNAIGAANCWSEIYGIMYLQENPTSYTTTATKWKCFKEATGRYSSGSMLGSPTQVTGPITGMKAVSISATNGIQIPEVIATGSSDTFVMACWVKPATTDYSGALFLSGASEMLIGWDTSGQCKWQYAGGYANPQFGLGKGSAWKLVVVQVSGSSALFYIDPTQSAFNVGSITSLTNLQYLGGADTAGSVKAGAYSICHFMIGKFAQPSITFWQNMQKNVDNIATLATPSAITTSSVSASLTLTGLVDGTEVRVYSGSTEVAGVESSSGGTFTYNYTSAFTATIVIHNLGKQYVRYASVSLSSSGATIPIQQINDSWYKGTVPSNLNSTNVTISTASTPYTIKLNNATTANLQDLYSYLMQLWKSDASLISKQFPFVPVTDEMFIMNDPWNFADSTTINSIKGAGWSRRNSSDVAIEEYCNVTTLGSINGTAYYSQTTSPTGSVTNAVASGAMNQAVKIYGNSSNGNVDYRSTAFSVYSRVLGYQFDSYDLLSAQSIPTLTFRKYALPLTSASADLNQTVTSTATLSGAPYNKMVLSDCKYAGVGSAWAATTAYVINRVLPVTWGSDTGAWVASTAYTQGQRISISGTDRGSWITARSYSVGDTVYAVDPTSGGGDCVVTWYCYSAHTSGGFSTDVSTKWVKFYGSMVCTTAHTSGTTMATDISDINKWAPSNAWVRATSAHTSGSSVYADLISGKLVAYEGARLVSGTWQLFTKTIDGGGLTLKNIYMAHQYRLTLASNILSGSVSKNGNLSGSYLGYVGNTLVTTTGVYVDNFAPADANSIEFRDYSGARVVNPITVTFTITGLEVNSEVDIFDPSTKVSITQVENTTDGTYSYSYTYTADKTVSIAIMTPTSMFIRYDNIVLGSQSQTLPVQLQEDRWD